MTMHQLSSLSGISISHLNRIERGERFPTGKVLKSIAKPLGFNEVELFGLASFLPPRITVGTDTNNRDYPTTGLDPNVASLLAKEPVSIQRLCIGIINMLKAIDLATRQDSEADD